MNIYRVPLDYDYLYDLYITQNKTAKEIAHISGWSLTTIAHTLSDMNIKRGRKIGKFKNKDWLFEQLIIKKRTQSDIGKECGVSQNTIGRYKELYRIEEPLFTKEFLYEEHIIKHKSMLQIAKETGHNNTSVRKYLDYYEIPVWTCRDNTNEYIDNHDGSTSVKVYNQHGQYLDSFIIDTDQTNYVKQHKWILSNDKIVKNRIRYRVLTGDHPSIVLGRYLLHIDNDDNTFVDHIDNDPLNNRLSNLRKVSRSENQMNHDLQINNKTGVTGVSWNKQKNKWFAQIGYKNNKYKIGYYKNIEDAVYARYYAETILFGEFRSNRNDNVILQYVTKCKIKKWIREYVDKIILNKSTNKRLDKVGDASVL